MKKPAIILNLIVAAFLIPSPIQAATEDLCAAAITEFKAKMIAAEAVRGAYRHNKSQKGRCVYLRSEMEYVVEASRMLQSCDHIRRHEHSSFIEKTEELLQRIKVLRNKFCGWQVAEASSIFQIYPAAERNLSH
jgi:hypothetical protein